LIHQHHVVDALDASRQTGQAPVQRHDKESGALAWIYPNRRHR
jgi:hypothetical protein